MCPVCDSFFSVGIVFMFDTLLDVEPFDRSQHCTHLWNSCQTNTNNGCFRCFGKTMNTETTQKIAFIKLIKPRRSQEVILFAVSIIDDGNSDENDSDDGGCMPAFVVNTHTQRSR